MLRYLSLLAVMAALSVGDRQTSLNAVNFATSLFQKAIEQHEEKNVVISPMAIRTALGLVYVGSEGRVADELANGLHLSTRDKSTIADKFKQLLNDHSNIRDIKCANKIYCKHDNRFKNEFKDIALTKFKTETENLNFDDTSNAVQTINNWILSKTNNEIDELVEQVDIDRDTKIVLTNALYFQGSWQKGFNKRNTRQRPFHTSKSGSINTEMMSKTSKVLTKHSQELNADIIKLPYTTEGLYMLIMLPRERDGLQNLQRNLNRINLLDLAESIVDKVDYDEISIPKFRVDHKLKLKNVLEKLGMGTLYTDDADLSKMVEQQAKVSKVIVEAQVDVNEEGLQPGIIEELRTVQGQQQVQQQGKKFIVDHPFLYTVMNEYGVLLVGQYVIPHDY